MSKLQKMVNSHSGFSLDVYEKNILERFMLDNDSKKIYIRLTRQGALVCDVPRF